ncbi:MAG: hypothetical protein ACFFEV_02630 [Candidatus Thorarchaeota archaeon]
MIEDLELLLIIAEITGVFVGFGALMGLSRPKDADKWQVIQIRGVVSIGLTVFVVALLPVLLSRYGVEGHVLWFICSVIYLVVNWGSIIKGFKESESRTLAKTQAKTQPIRTIFFWLLLEVLMQGPLYLILLGTFPELEPALFTTSLLFNLFEGVYLLTQVVYGQTESSDGEYNPHFNHT